MTEICSAPLRIPSAWTAAEMQRSARWVYQVSAPEIAELDAALAQVKARRLAAGNITQADFPLPIFAPKLAEILHELEHGAGVMLMRGLPVARWGEADSMTVYWGIGTYLGKATAQNAVGNYLDHVRSTGRDWDTDPTVRGYQTTAHLPFHCDKADVVGLLCLHGAKSGGESCIASSVAIHNAIIERRPDLIDALYAPLYVDHRGEEPTGRKPYYLQPMYAFHNGRMFARMGGKYAESAQRFPEVPRLTPQQIEAMRTVEAMAQSDEFRLDMVFEPGDIQWLNNHVIQHSRARYEDWPEPERWRHLVRMLLFTPAYREDIPPHVAFLNDLTRWWRDNPRAPKAAAE